MTKQRIERLRILMQENHLPALLVTNSFNRSYLSGFTGTSGYALITADKAILLTDFRYMTQAPQQVKHMDVLEHKANFMESVKEVLHDLNIQELGFEQHDVFYGAYSQYSMVLDAIKLVPTSYLVEQLRLYKDEHELAIMREAALLADRTFTHILPFLKPGVSELDIALEMEFFMRKNGAKSSSFDTIVASGERSALPHGVASERLLKSNEFVKLDFGAYYQGYCSDITRTVVLGKPTEKHKEIYGIVQEAQAYALANIKQGMTGKQADALARDLIVQKGYGQNFGHGTGHGLGMEIHEAPRLSPQSDVVLKEGMVVTVEPGIYVPGFGGVRIEDDIVITHTGIEILTHSSKDLILLD